MHGAGEIAADAVDTGVGVRDWHLRTGQYLDTSQHPRIRVELDQVHLDEARPTCSVTIRDTTHPVAVTVQRLEHDGNALRIGLTTDLDRTPFPMLPPAAGVSRTVHLDVELVATPAG